MVYMSLITIICVSSLASYIDKKRYGTYFAPSSVLAWPLTASALLIVFFGRPLGFYDIDPLEILILALGIAAFSAGSILATLLKSKALEWMSKRGRHVHLKNKHIVNEWRNLLLPAKWITSLALLAGVIRLLVLIFRDGIAAYVSTDGYDAALMYGFPAHVILIGYALAPLLFADAMLNKNIYSGIIWVGYLVLLFSSFVKYHVVLFVLVSFIFVMTIEKKTIKILFPLLIILPIVIFVLSYVFIFASKGLSFEDNYLVKHLLNYLCCGILYTSVNMQTLAIPYMAPINVFIAQFVAIPNKIFDLLSLPQWPVASPPYVYLSQTERGNVINIITMFFYTKNYLTGLFFIVLFSLVLSLFVYKTENKLTSSVILALLLLSFFGDFFVLLLVWEVILYSLILCRILSIVIYSLTIRKERKIN